MVPRERESATPDAQFTRQQITQRLLSLISNRTGYSIDMLEPDQDLEAELGIDSVTRVEILVALQMILVSDSATKVQQLVRAKTLNHLIDQLLDSTVTQTNSEATTTANAPSIFAHIFYQIEKIDSMIEAIASKDIEKRLLAKLAAEKFDSYLNTNENTIELLKFISAISDTPADVGKYLKLFRTLSKSRLTTQATDEEVVADNVLLNGSQEFDKSDTRIKVNQSKTRRLREDACQELLNLANVVAEL